MMSGWKTWVSSIMGIAGGIGRMCAAILSDPVDAQGFWEGFLVLCGSFGIIGIGHKIEKSR
jgi:hypothetical protein